MTISKQFLTVNPYSRPGKPLAHGVRGVVIHYTADPGATAQNIRDYFESLKKGGRWASAHYAVGLEGEIVQCIPDEEEAYHVGAQPYQYKKAALDALKTTYPNNCTLGIELCIDRQGKFTAATLASGIALAQELLTKYSLTPDDLYRHYDITGKVCPKPFVDNPAAWTAFREDVAQAFRS
jgi:N-acetylmuramoyl-L-alanine amidase